MGQHLIKPFMHLIDYLYFIFHIYHTSNIHEIRCEAKTARDPVDCRHNSCVVAAAAAAQSHMHACTNTHTQAKHAHQLRRGSSRKAGSTGESEREQEIARNYLLTKF